MIEKVFNTNSGDIHYYINEIINDRITLVFLPGLTADNRLFARQVEYFENKYNVLVWDAPGHFHSRPFILNFDLFQKARWLKEILDKEGIDKPVLIGQSMGGYVSQAFIEQFPKFASGFVSIDSCPCAKEYTTAIEIWLLKRIEPVYRLYPWKPLIKAGSKGVATTRYGQELMKEMMTCYSKDEYVRLAGHGYRMLGEAMDSNYKYQIDCPCILICGLKDLAGSAKSYNRRWHKKTGLPLYWLKDAGHNSNTDKPDEVNKLIEEFVNRL